VTGSRHELPCRHFDIMDLVPKGCYNEGDNFEKKKYDIFSSPLLLKPLCGTHGCNCPGLASVDMDVSGLPCVDNSRSKIGRLFQEGPSGPLFVVWALRLKRLGIKMGILENTPDIVIQTIYFLLYDLYDIFQIFADMEDCGHSGISRSRTYIIVVMRNAMKQIYCPVQLHTEISSFIKATVRTTPSDYLTASDLEVKLEAAEVARVRGIVFRSNSLDLSYLLNDRELDAIEQLCKAYEDRFEEQAVNDCNLVFFLGDNPGWAKTWSAVSKRIPTYRRNSSSGKMWYPSRGRWLTHAERCPSLQ
ncbi:unnamed protein product, partial [Polarella glacialis]